MSSSTPIMTTYGRVQGTTHNGVSVWRGIPFAKPPIGPLRFRAPQSPDPWTTVRDATKFGPKAMQPKSMLGSVAFSSEPISSQPASEDCLTLNVYSPPADGNKRPVMVWIHGGGYYAGSSALYDPSRLAANGDIVAVTFNYRLGPFGFLYLKDIAGDSGAFDSNLATRDQIAALRWVRDNIATFGGDPQQVTIFGESAGGTSITNLLASPAARGLFQQAIAESPIPASVVDNSTATAMATAFLKHLGMAKKDAVQIATMPAEKLIAVVDAYMQECLNTWTGVMAFSPIYGDDILPEPPIQALAAGAAKGVPLLIGTNHDESTLFQSAGSAFPRTPPLIRKMLTRMYPDAMDHILAAYPGFPAKSAQLAISRDTLFRIPSICAAEAQAQHAPVWMYRFDWASAALRLRGFNATHGIEIPFILDQLDSRTARLFTSLSWKPTVHALSRRMQACWLSFARDGDPGQGWSPYDPAKGRQTMIFNSTDHVEQDPDGAQRQAWDGVLVHPPANSPVETSDSL